MNKIFALCFGLVMFVPFQVMAVKKTLGIKFEETMDVEGKKLTLNGMGIRKKEIALGFKVNVYVGAIYLEKTSNDAKAIIGSPETKLVKMVYAHGVDKETARKTWQENFDKFCAKCEALKPQLESFKGMIEDMDPDNVQDFIFTGSKIKVNSKKKSKGEIDSAEFQKFLLSIWLENAPNPELKDGMLGTVIPD